MTTGRLSKWLSPGSLKSHSLLNEWRGSPVADLCCLAFVNLEINPSVCAVLRNHPGPPEGPNNDMGTAASIQALHILIACRV
jgi:hypothetical protein